MKRSVRSDRGIGRRHSATTAAPWRRRPGRHRIGAARKASRRGQLEQLEPRHLLAADWQNPLVSLDVSQDGVLAPNDVLQGINRINLLGSGPLPATRQPGQPYYDVNGDRIHAPNDILAVVNALNSGLRLPIELTEGNRLASQRVITIGLGQESGARTYRLELATSFDTSDNQAILEDVFNVYLIDPASPGETLLDQGQPGTALFSLRGAAAEYTPGQVRFDGRVLEIDLTTLASRSQGQLVLQLLSTDADTGTRINVRPLSNLVDPQRDASPTLDNASLPISAGGGLDLGALTQSGDLAIEVSDARFNTGSGRFAAELRLRNQGVAAGRQLAAVFPGLPAGVSLRNPSGTTSAGDPYLNLAPAVRPGGLLAGGVSEAVLVEFDNPSGARFSFVPVVLAGPANRAPDFPAIAPQTVMPGGVLNLRLQATDPDGDPLRFTLDNISQLPSGVLRGNGQLRIAPTPDQLGTYQFTATASDGALSTSQEITQSVVPDPLTTTRVSGWVLDTFSNPLANVPVSVGNVSALTDQDGAFLLDFGGDPLPSDTLKIHGEAYVGAETFPFIAEKLPLLLERELFAQVNNVIDRPIYLPALDLANAVPIDPAADTLVTTAAIPGASVFVGAGTLEDQQGGLFSGQLSITEVPVEFTPAALPANQATSLVVTIQPGEMVFTQPAPLTLPNREGWPPGTLLDLYSINPVTGQFDDVGDARVSADGTLVETISGGIRNSSWHFVAPPPPDWDEPDPEDDDDCDDDCNCKASAPAGSDVLLHSGALHEEHALPTYVSLDQTRGVVLHYNSQRADVRPIIPSGIDNVPDDPELRIVAELTVRRGDFRYELPGYAGGELGLNGGEHVWDVPEDGGDLDIALQVDLSSQPTGIYDIDLMTGLRRMTGNMLAGTSSVRQTRLTVVNEIASPFGAGWSIAGLTRLFENPNGMLLLVDGEGAQLQFTPPVVAGQPYGNRPGDFSTLVKLPDNSYRRTMTDRTVYQFDTAGRLATITDRNGNQTQYDYDGLGNLVSITDPAGLATIFSYAGGRVAQITDPAGRATQLEYDAAGNLIRITDPDSAQRQFLYDAQHRMIGEIDALGRQEFDVYDFAGRIRQVIHKDGTVQQFQPWQSQILFPPERTSDPLNPPTAIRARDRIASVADQNGHVVEYTLDRAGQIISARDAVGALPVTLRSANNRVTQASDGRGHITLFEYDLRGNLISWRDEISGAGGVLGQIGQPGEVDQFVFDAVAGQRLFYDAAGTQATSLRVQLLGPAGEVLVSNSGANNDFGTLLLPADGQYRLRVFGEASATGVYEFRLFSPAQTVRPLVVDQDTSGTIEVPGQLDVYLWQGTVGQRVFFDSLLAPLGNLRVSLLTPSGTRLMDNSSAAGNYGPFTLGEAGEYRLLIFGDGDDLGDYRFRLAESLLTTTALAYDTNVQGTIAVPGEADEYTFTGTVGDRLLFDSAGTLPGDLRYSLVSPTGEVLINNASTDSDSGVVTIDTPGTYRLLVFGTTDATGSYDFRLTSSTVTVQPLVLGMSTAGSISQPGEMVIYTFTPQVGDILLYDGLGTAPGDIRLDLWGPHGEQLINFESSENNRGRVTIDQPGQYQLQVFGNGDDTGDYAFRLVASLPSLTPIALNTPVTGTLDEPGEIDIYTFDLAVGDRIRYDALLNVGPDIRYSLISPMGVVLLNNQSVDVDQNPLAATEAGTYKLAVFANGDDIGAYEFQVLDLATTPLTLAVPQSVMLNPGTSTQTFQHQGTAGQRLSLQSLQGALGTWKLVGPDGRDMSSNFNLSTNFTATLPANGLYTLIVSGDNLLGPVNFQFQADDVTDAPVLPSGLGMVQSGTIAAGQQMSFQFDIPAGLPVYLDSLTPTGTPLDFDLRNPSGQTVLLSNDMLDRGPVVASRSGTWTVLVRGDTAASSGNFAFRLLDGSQATPLAMATPITTNLGPFEAQLYQFDVMVGDRLFYDALESDPDDTRLALSTPTGEFLAGAFGSVNSDVDSGSSVRADEPGTYLLVMENRNNAASDAQFQFLRGMTTPTELINYGQVINGTISQIAELDLYTFSGSVGDRIFYDALQNDPDDIRISLISPLGNRLIGPFGPENSDSDRGPAILEEAGLWYLLFEGQGSSTGDYAFRVVQSTTSVTPIIYGAMVGGSIDVAGEQDIYTFSGAAGQRVFYDALQNDADDTRVTLVSPRGIRLIGVFGPENSDTDRGPFMLEETGTYQLILEGNGQATGDYAFRVVESQITTTAIGYDQVVAGSVDVVGELDVFTFTGVVGDRIYYDALQNDPDDVRVTLISPLGNRVIGVFGPENSDNNFGPFTLTETGTFLLALHGNGQQLGDYLFRVVKNEQTVADLQIGQSISGSIDRPGAADVYQFQATAGQTLLYDALASNPDSISILLETPSDQRLIGPFGPENADNDSGLLRITETGMHRLIVVGNTDATGNYGFRLQDVAGTSLPIGQPILRSVSGRGQAWYEFQGTAGARFYLEDLGTPAGQGSYFLIHPNQSLLTSRGLGSDLEQVLPADGVYRLGIDAESASPLLDVMFQARLNADLVTALTLNSPLMGSLNQAGDQLVYTFFGAAGQQVLLDSLGSGLPSLTTSLVAPSGQIISQGSTITDGTPQVLTETGTHRLVIGGTGDQTGAFALQLVNLSTAPLITQGTPVTNTLGPGGGALVYRLQGRTGQRLAFDDLDGSASRGSWTLYATGALQLAQQPLNADFQATLPADGTYLLVLAGANPAAPAAVHFQVTDTQQPVVPLSGLANNFTGSILAGQQTNFNFTAPAGTRIVIDSRDVDNDPVAIDLRDPLGSLLLSQNASTDSGLLTLPLSGTYSLTVRGNTAASTGDYDFRVLTEAGASLVGANTLVQDGVAAQEARLYRFRGFTGQTIYLDVALDSFSGIPLRLYDADGRQVESSSTNIGVGPITLRTSGNYLLLVGNSATARNYGFQFLDGLSAPRLAIETPVTDAVTAGMQADLYRLDAEAGQRLFFDSSGGTSGASTWQVFAPGNVRLANANLNNDFELTIPSDGTYLLLVDGVNLVTDNYTIRILAPTSIVAPIAPEATNRTATGRVTYTYDPVFNQVTSVTDELGHMILYGIDPSNGNVVSETRVVGALGGNDDVVTQFTYTTRGLLDTVTDPLGRVTNYDYDALGRLLSITFAAGTAEEAVRSYEYDAAGNLTAMVDENGQRSMYAYDPQNRLTRITRPDPDGLGPLLPPVTEYEYDLAGNLIGTIDALANETRYEYDKRDRRVRRLDPAGGETRYGYDPAGNLLSITNELGHVQLRRYDARSRPVEQIDQGGARAFFEFDLDDNLTAVVDPLGNRTQFEYDARGREVRRLQVPGRVSEFEYDPADNLVQRIDRNGRVTTYAYDELNRLVSETWFGDGNVVNYAYDNVSNLVSVADSFSAIALTYDARNRLASVDNDGTPGVPRVVLAYAYDPVGNLLSVSDTIDGTPGGVNQYAYDGLHRLVRILQSGNGVTDKRVDLGYNALDQFQFIARFSDPGGLNPVVDTEFSYDQLNRLTSLHHRNPADSDISFFDFVYDASGRVTQITDAVGVTTYGYDVRDQLTSANHTAPSHPDETYAYDANGNRLASHLPAAAYSTGPHNRLLADGRYSYEYDDQGNLLRRTELATNNAREFQWDHRNRLRAVIDRDAGGEETQRVEFTYDAWNRRLSKSVTDATDSVVTHFVYDGEHLLLEFVDDDGAVGPNALALAQRYLHGPAVDQVLAQEDAGGDVLWHLTDHQGTVTDLVDSSGTVRNHLVYDAFGNVVSQSDPAAGSRYRYTGREYDEETGLHFYRARYYDAQSGRFVSEDPIGFAGGHLNLFSYVGNDVVNSRDPSGLQQQYGQQQYGQQQAGQYQFYQPAGQTANSTNSGLPPGWSVTTTNNGSIVRDPQGRTTLVPPGTSKDFEGSRDSYGGKGKFRVTCPAKKQPEKKTQKPVRQPVRQPQTGPGYNTQTGVYIDANGVASYGPPGSSYGSSYGSSGSSGASGSGATQNVYGQVKGY